MPITPSPAVLRAGDVLHHLIRHPTESFTVSELARAVGVPRATCDSILQALAERGFLTRDGERRYELGPGSIALGEAARIANPCLGAAKREADRLARDLRACVSVCVRDAETARVVEAFDFGPLFAVRARVGQAIPLVPPFGAVFVAWSDEDTERWLARAGDELGADERDRYRRALEAVRRRGYSVAIATPGHVSAETVDTLAHSPASDDDRLAREALIRGAMHSAYLAVDFDGEGPVRVGQLSAPVFDRTGGVAASLMLPGPDRDVGPRELDALAGQLLEAAARATRAAGGREPGSRPEPETAGALRAQA